MYNMWPLRVSLQNVRSARSKEEKRCGLGRAKDKKKKKKVTALNERENSGRGGSCAAAESGHQMFVSS